MLKGTARHTPLRLAASKAATGHAEPASGLVGLLAVQRSLIGAAAAPIHHLRALNPHVDALLQSLPAATGKLALSIPRQQGGEPASAQGHAEGACGVSAFAFQGTNAHAILRHGSGGGGAELTTAPALTWRQSRFWVAVPAHPLVQGVLKASFALNRKPYTSCVGLFKA